MECFPSMHEAVGSILNTVPTRHGNEGLLISAAGRCSQQEDKFSYAMSFRTAWAT